VVIVQHQHFSIQGVDSKICGPSAFGSIVLTPGHVAQAPLEAAFSNTTPWIKKRWLAKTGQGKNVFLEKNCSPQTWRKTGSQVMQAMCLAAPGPNKTNKTTKNAKKPRAAPQALRGYLFFSFKTGNVGVKSRRVCRFRGRSPFFYRKKNQVGFFR
jgi:hypothetical protein